MQTSIENKRKNPLHLSIRDSNIPIPKKIIGSALLGFLEVLFVVSIFIISFIVSMSFFPSIEGRISGSLFNYGIIMTTVCVAGFLGISVFSKKFREKYPKTIKSIEKFLYLDKNKKDLQ